MSLSDIKVAIVEDNGMARINLRNHLMEMGFSEIGCFSNGRELKAHARLRRIDLLLMDYHLGQNKNGVEVVQELQEQGLLKSSTSIIFITSDRLPMIVGQIVDVHPDALVIKPYTIRSIEKNISACLNFHHYLMPVFKLMDEDEFAHALDKLNYMLERNSRPRMRSQMVKLQARLLIKVKRFKEAASVYNDVLRSSDKIIWAKWGLIQSLYLDGQIKQSEDMLLALTGTQLTSDKAREWLARICIDANQYAQAEDHINAIREGEMSVSAARLKAYIYQAQERNDEAIQLLEKKRESNRGIRERYDELSLDLARCYLQEAEGKKANEREKTLQVAKFLIGSAGRKNLDQKLIIKKDFLYAAAAVMAGNIEKASELLNREGMDDMTDSDVLQMTDAISAWKGIGNDEKASEILALCKMRLSQLDDGNETTVANMQVVKREESIGERRPEAMKLNKTGLEHYIKHDYQKATQDFYQAYLLFPREVAFSLNLLQSLVEAEQGSYKTINTRQFLSELSRRQMAPNNQKRLEDIAKKVEKSPQIFS
ncbi:response regulator receiver protein [Paraglaciecola mesophila KMM 241]|uniref:Response regulator receiver protein n=1 Tax=Paraglaciecola mesophila KMM 241 TaxID=1128912 RepID=K6ZGF4_9ALTE|nr:response regulator [Paraglaciecola mesophila]GAC22470.1 response regulator receiver protein [Paraglaciecola mesophila KMM 241]|tara:strand:+ start:530 stop:2149 length:1620 start_codon:yes stop_codon:yes gene_type:complete